MSDNNNNLNGYTYTTASVSYGGTQETTPGTSCTPGNSGNGSGNLGHTPYFYCSGINNFINTINTTSGEYLTGIQFECNNSTYSDKYGTYNPTDNTICDFKYKNDISNGGYVSFVMVSQV